MGDDDVEGTDLGRAVGRVECDGFWAVPRDEFVVVGDGVHQVQGVCTDQDGEDDCSCGDEEGELPGLGVYGEGPSTKYASDDVQHSRWIKRYMLRPNENNVNKSEGNDLVPVNEVPFWPKNSNDKYPEASLECGSSSLSRDITWLFQSSSDMFL